MKIIKEARNLRGWNQVVAKLKARFTSWVSELIKILAEEEKKLERREFDEIIGLNIVESISLEKLKDIR